MCYSNCPYENWNGECSGMHSLKKGRPHCFNEVTNEEWIAEAEAGDKYDDDDDDDEYL